MSRGFARSEELFAEAQHIIPGGVTSARHPGKFVPGAYPIFMNRGRGCRVWDVDGNEYVDWVMSFGPMVLGHRHPGVDRAVRRSLDDGFCFTMVHPLQNDLARELIDTIPCAEMAKFFLGGSDATSAAIRIARIATGRDKIVRWGYHGWHDWCYAGAGSDRAAVGVPAGITQDILTFTYNDLDSLSRLFEEHPGRIAGIIMQPYETSKELPREGFLEGVLRLAHGNGAVVIFDEIRSGFRVALGGAQEYFKVTPDMSCVSKAMANGFPISAVVGRRDVMEAAGRTRFSATFFVNSFPMAAALETIRTLKRTDAVAHMWRIGRRLMDGLSRLGEEMDVPLQMTGLPPIPMLRFTDADEKRREAIRTAFFTETTRRGILFHPGHCWFLSTAHTDRDVDRTLEVARASLRRAREVPMAGAR